MSNKRERKETNYFLVPKKIVESIYDEINHGLVR